ncbi:MAG TPA: hypothetical protein VFR64_21030, partial [Methylomirabilota bacterium]|nr:hypothetical protein [Methylomirabilota bacterium]
INIARICRRQGAYETAEHYYRRAFATTQGTRTEGDRVYTNVCFARLEEARGRPAEAFGGWMRAALHWVSSSAPEALGSRVATAIVGRKVASGDPEEVSSAMESALAAAAGGAGLAPAVTAIEAGGRSSDAPVFLQADQLGGDIESGALDYAVLGSGWSVLSSRAPARAQLDAPRFRRLRAILFHLIQLAAPPSLLRDATTLVVDHGYGTEMPTTLRELVQLSLRLPLGALVVDDDLLEVPHEARARLERNLRLRLGRAVDGLHRDGPRVWVAFKRYLVPRLLADAEARILESLEAPVPIDELRERRLGDNVSHDQILAFMRSMERSRLVDLEVPDELVTILARW